MKTATLTDVDHFEIEETKTPSPAAGEVLVRVHYTGICGSDVPRALEGRVHGFPIVLGHEFSGVVEEVGAGVDSSFVGTRVSGIPLIPCNDCDDCRDGNFSLCHSYSFVGSRRNGSMAQFVVLPASNVIPVSDSVSDLEAAFFEPATVGAHAIELAGVKKGTTAIVIGAGTIGLLIAQELLWYGVSRVVVANRSLGRLNTAAELGLPVVCTSEEDWVSELDPRGFDYVFDTVANSQTIVDSMSLAKSRGTVCFVGTPKRDLVLTSKNWELINRKELTLKGSWMSYSSPWPGVEWKNVEKMFAEGALVVSDAMIDRIYDLGDTQKAFERFKDASGVKGKILIDSWKA